MRRVASARNVIILAVGIKEKKQLRMDRVRRSAALKKSTSGKMEQNKEEQRLG